MNERDADGFGGGGPREAATAGGPVRSPARAADPGSRRSGRIAVIAAVACALAVIGLQNTPVVPPAVPAPPTSVEPGRVSSPFELVGRIMLKLYAAAQDDLRAKGMEPRPAPGGGLVMEQLGASAVTPAEWVRVAIVEAETLGPEAALERLDGVERRIDATIDQASGADEAARERGLTERDADRFVENTEARAARASDLARDIELLRRVYESDEPATAVLSEDERARLARHHGVFGEAVATRGLDPASPERRAVRSGAYLVTGLLLLAFAAGAIGLIAGVVLIIVGAVQISRGRWRPVMPVPNRGGSVYLEVFALFAGGFAAMQVIGIVVERAYGPGGNGPPEWFGAASFAAMWLLTPMAAWPMLRGMARERWLGTIGLHRGRGVLREVGAGLLGYVAMVPLYVIGVLIALLAAALVELVRQAVGGGGGEPIGPTESPVFELVSGPAWSVGLVFLMAVVWAPVTEELVFRGALYRHLRSWSGVGVAGAGSAIVFGLFHSYGVLLIWPVVMLGLGFALLREWRGSLIACITAHALHNFLVLSLVTLLVRTLS